MAKRKTVHVVPHGDDWAVKTGGSEKAHRVVPNKSQAEQIARQVARNQDAELLIHGRDGRIQRADSHGGDPNPPRDKK